MLLASVYLSVPKHGVKQLSCWGMLVISSKVWLVYSVEGADNHPVHHEKEKKGRTELRFGVGLVYCPSAKVVLSGQVKCNLFISTFKYNC